MQFQPLIRWSGAKRKQSEDIINAFPCKMGTLWLPFLGGGSILYQFVNSNIKYDRIVASDLDSTLMGIWDLIQNDPARLLCGYTALVNMQDNSGDIVKFYDDRVYEYNIAKTKDPILFYFIIRCCGRGSILYDKYGNFCTPMIANSPPARPDTIEPLLDRWHEAVQGVEFRCESYEKCLDGIQDNDYIFLDPPYFDGSWYLHNNMDWDALWRFLQDIPCDYSMTLNGDKDVYPIPKGLYNDHKYIYYGISTASNGQKAGVRDSLWIRNNKGEYSDIPNVRNNMRPGGGKSNNTTTDMKALFELNDRVTKMEGMLSKIVGLLGGDKDEA